MNEDKSNDDIKYQYNLQNPTILEKIRLLNIKNYGVCY